MRETEYGTKLILLAGPHGIALHRNNNGATPTPAGQWIWFGLGASKGGSIGSSDYIGGIMITVGSVRIDAFVAIEMKKPGWKKPADERERKQAAFIAAINFRGGFGAFCEASDAGIEKCLQDIIEFRNEKIKQMTGLSNGSETISTNTDR
jgi:hypothetical protein